MVPIAWLPIPTWASDLLGDLFSNLWANLGAELLGIGITVLIVNRMIRSSDDKRWARQIEPVKLTVYSCLLELTGRILKIALPSEYWIPARNAYVFNYHQSNPIIELLPPLRYGNHDEINKTVEKMAHSADEYARLMILYSKEWLSELDRVFDQVTFLRQNADEMVSVVYLRHYIRELVNVYERRQEKESWTVRRCAYNALIVRLVLEENITSIISHRMMYTSEPVSLACVNECGVAVFNSFDTHRAEMIGFLSADTHVLVYDTLRTRGLARIHYKGTADGWIRSSAISIIGTASTHHRNGTTELLIPDEQERQQGV